MRRCPWWALPSRDARVHPPHPTPTPSPHLCHTPLSSALQVMVAGTPRARSPRYASYSHGTCRQALRAGQAAQVSEERGEGGPSTRLQGCEASHAFRQTTSARCPRPPNERAWMPRRARSVSDHMGSWCLATVVHTPSASLGQSERCVCVGGGGGARRGGEGGGGSQSASGWVVPHRRAQQVSERGACLL